jgi:Zn-dependent M16 (insulinase) family peptidase
MDKLKSSLTKEELTQIDTQAAKLKKFQSEADTPEAAAMLPKLKLEDIPRKVEIIPTQKSIIENVQTLTHDLFTNGIAYVDLAFDLGHIPEELHLYLPLLGKMTTGMGAAGFNYEEMAKRIALKMGGFGYDLSTGFTADAKASFQKIIFSFSALYRKLPEAINIITDIFVEGDLSAKARMRDLLSERKNNLQSAIVPSGHIFAKRAAGAALTVPAYRDEQWHGRTQLRFVQQKAGSFESAKSDLQEKLHQLKSLVFNKENLLINITADEQGVRLVRENIFHLLQKLPANKVAQEQKQPQLAPVYAGIAVPTSVSYVASVLKAPAYIDPASAMLMLASKELSNSYLYKHIRVQGGAYGGMSSFDPSLGLFSFISYRDPHIAQTLQIFKDAQAFFSQNEMAEGDMEKAIISTIGALDKPLDPSGRGYAAMMRIFAGATDEMRQNFRDNVLAATPRQVKDTLKDYFSAAAKSKAVAVYSASEKLAEANLLLDEKLIVENLIEE